MDARADAVASAGIGNQKIIGGDFFSALEFDFLKCISSVK
jgi:hypothetical protein